MNVLARPCSVVANALAVAFAVVTRIMFEAGFQTKSNFNRDFRRVTGMSPIAWRTRKAGIE